MQRKNELALSMLMHRNFRVVLGHLQAAGNRRAIGLVRVQVKAGSEMRAILTLTGFSD